MENFITQWKFSRINVSRVQTSFDGPIFCRLKKKNKKFKTLPWPRIEHFVATSQPSITPTSENPTTPQTNTL